LNYAVDNLSSLLADGSVFWSFKLASESSWCLPASASESTRDGGCYSVAVVDLQLDGNRALCQCIKVAVKVVLTVSHNLSDIMIVNHPVNFRDSRSLHLRASTLG
jgi:hypothetical protein